MTSGIVSLRKALSTVAIPRADDRDDYRIAARVGTAFLARGRSGLATLLAPLAGAIGTVGRCAGGFTLTAVPRVAFDFDGHRWERSAAILACTNEDLTDTFLVLVEDFARKLPGNTGEVTWPAILAWVEGWQALLRKRPVLSSEEQLGLWGELWVMSCAKEGDQMFSAWRGPERDAVDFFHDGAALEVKTSRRAHRHYVSRSQVTAPRGDCPSYFLSIWVGMEQVRGLSLSELVEALLARLMDPPALLRQLALAGYSPQDRNEYATRFVVLEAPLWFRAEDIPQVRDLDAGISELRYVVSLDVDKSLDEDRVKSLMRHFGSIQSTAIDERTEAG